MAQGFGGHQAVRDVEDRMAKAGITGATFEAVCDQYLLDQEILPGEAMIKDHPQSANRQGTLVLGSNIFRARPTPITIFQHDVKIEGRFRDDRDWESFTASSSVDFFNMERREACARIFDVIRKKVPVFQQHPKRFFYDRRSTLYTTVDLGRVDDIDHTFGMKDLVEQAGLDQADANQMAAFRGFTSFHVVISRTGKQISTDLRQLSASQEVGNMNPEFVHFLDVASSQAVMDDRDHHISFPNGVSYFVDPSAYGYNQGLELSNGVYLAPGITKSARLLQSSTGSGCDAAIVIEPKLSPFHAIQTVAEKVEGVAEGKMLSLLRGLFVYPAHLFRRQSGSSQASRVKTFKIVSLGEPPAQVSFENSEGNRTNVLEYFKNVHNYTIEKPHLPTILVEHAKTGKKEYYPMEVCEVLDNQRLATSALTGEITAAIIKMAAVPPSTLSVRINQGAKALNLNSQYMQEAKITVDQQSIELTVPVLPVPQMAYGQQVQRYDLETNKFRSGRYTHAIPLGSQWGLYAVCRMGQKPTHDQLVGFGQKLVQVAGSKGGMRLNPPGEVQVLSEEIRDPHAPPTVLKGKMQAAKAAGCKFVMIVSSIEDTVIHAALKTYEQELGIVTQNCTFKKLEEVGAFGGQYKPLMYENIVHKMNMKLGGINYTLQTPHSQPDRSDLILGVYINQAAGGRGEAHEGSAPSVIGYAANDGGDPSAFTGDFVFQSAARGIHLSALEKVVTDVFQRYMQQNRNQPPKRVVLYRNGVSEGDYAQVLRYEIPVIRKQMEKAFNNPNLLTFVVCTRIHNARFWPKNYNRQARGAIAQNAQAGTVIDSQVVHPTVPEFYLATCRSAMGTAKIPRYAVLHNSAKMSMEDIQQLTLNLGFAHQIVTMPTSTPSPVYIAEEYAKRGRNLYNARAMNGRPGAKDGSPAALTEVLALKNTEIRNQRVNA